MRPTRSQRSLTAKRNYKRGNSSLGRRASTLEMLEGRQLLAGDTSVALAPLQNPHMSRDVNHDNRVSPMDALLVINDLARNGSRSIAPSAAPLAATTSGTTTSTTYLDVSGDNRITPIDALRVINLLAVDKLMRVRTFATDLAGNPIESVSAGTQYRINTEVTDIRNPISSTPGVFANYVDVSYDPSISSIDPGATVTFDPFFSLLRSFDLSNAGTILDVGAAATSLAAPGNAPQPIWSVIATATSTGVQTLTPTFDAVVGHDSLLYGIDNPLLPDEIDFVGDTFTVVSNPTISISNVTQAEGNTGSTPATPFVFNVTLSNVFDQQVTVVVNTADPASGTPATPGADYVAITNQTLTFAPGVTSLPVTVQVIGDTLVENNEAFNVVLSNPSDNATLDASVGVGTIVDDDTLGALSIGDVTVQNVTTGTTTALFTVSLSSPATLPVSFNFATSDDSALAGVDYIAVNQQFTIDVGQSSVVVPVTIIGDPNVDDVDKFNVTISSPDNATISDGTAVGTILPAVALPSVSVSSVTLPEGNSGNTPFVFTISLSNSSNQNVVVSYATSDGTATVAGLDYLPVLPTLLTFAPGQTSLPVTVQVLGDLNVETNENFSLTVTPVSGTLNTNPVVGTGNIVNDDGAPTIVINDVTVVAGGTSSVSAVFTVTMTSIAPSQVIVGFGTADLTAVANVDYIPQSGNLTFNPGGSLTQTITVPIISRPEEGDDVQFAVNISKISGPVDVVDDSGIGTIVRQGLTISNPSVIEDKGDLSSPGNALFTVSLTRPLSDIVTVAYKTADGTATVANSDYVATSGTLTFQPGQTSKVISVAINADSIQEPNENFFVDLSNPTNSVTIVSRGVGTIINDDGSDVAVTVELADPTTGQIFAPNKVLQVGDQFLLDVFVQDTQSIPTGVLQTYVNALFNSNLVSVVPNTLVFGSGFPGLNTATITAGGIIDVGGFAAAPPADPTAPQLLFQVILQANDVGLATFSTTVSANPDHQVLVFGNDLPVIGNFDDTASINIGENVFTIDSVTKAEGNSGTTDFVFTVTRFLPSNNAATVVVSTSDGTAKLSDNDYDSLLTTLTFAVGEVSKTVTVKVRGDAKDEENETFNVNLTNAIGATASNAPGVGTITDDDAPSALSVTGGTASEGGSIVFTVKLAPVSGRTVTVQYATASGTATSGLDFNATSGLVTFQPGETTKFVTVQTLTDLLAEPTETFQLVLSNPVNGTISNSQATGSITDVPPARITGVVYIDLNSDGVKQGNESGIGDVLITATNQATGLSQSTLTNANGTFEILGLPPGKYTLRETQPGFYGDGRDTRFSVDTATSDVFTNIDVVSATESGGFYFGEAGVMAEFAVLFLNRRSLFGSAVSTGITGSGHIGAQNTPLDLRGSDVWLSYDGGWQGLRTIQATFDGNQGTAAMTLYSDVNGVLVQRAISSPNGSGASLSYTGTQGPAYFLKISGTSPNVKITYTGGISPGFLAVPAAQPDGNSSGSSGATASPPAAAATTETSSVSSASLFASASSNVADSSDDATDEAFAEDEDWYELELV